MWFIYVTAIAAGLCVGSFLNLLIHRGPSLWGLVDRSGAAGGLLSPGSYCRSCRTTIRRWDLVPVLSYLLLQGRCRTCRTAISPRYPIVELLSGAAAAAAIAVYDVSIAALFVAAAIFVFIALAAIDLETGYLPDALTLPLIVLGLIANGGGLVVPLPDAVIGAIAGYAAFYVIGLLYRTLRGRDGLGLGDAKMLAAIGAWVGWAALPGVVFLASVTTLIVAAIRYLRDRSLSVREALAFGPGLGFAGATMLLLAGTGLFAPLF